MNSFNKLLLTHIITAFIIISIFVTLYSRPQSIIALHIGLITSLYCTAFYISRIWKSQFKHVSVIIFTGLSSLLILVYIADFLSNRLWNDNVSLQSILAFIIDLPILLEDVPFGITILVIFVSVIFISIYWLYTKHCHYLHTYDSTLTLKQSRIYILVTIGTLLFAYLSFKPTDPGIWDGEPISNLAIKANTISHLNQSGGNITFDKNANPVNRELQNIILIHADAIRADHMSGYGYQRETTPFIDSLIEKNAVQIETGLSICSESVCGILSALSSQHIDSVNEQTPMIQSHLKQAGYRALATGSGKLSWENVDSYISRDVDYFERADQHENYSMNDDSIILSTLSKIPEYEGFPTFFFLHYMSSHPTGRHFSQYTKFTPSEKNLLSYIFPALDDPSIAVNAYDNNIVQFDDMVRKSIGLLTEKGYMDNSILIIYGDHGEAFNEHGYFGHYHYLFQEEIHVPIIFISSKNQVFKEKKFATLNDILPTTLDMLNLPIPDDIEGISLLRDNGNRTTYHDSRNGIYAIIEKDESVIYKLMFNSKNEKKYFYNLTEDPGEKNNLYDSEPAKAEELLENLKSHFKLV